MTNVGLVVTRHALFGDGRGVKGGCDSQEERPAF